MTTSKQCGAYLIHLLCCALNDKTPDPKPDAVTWDELLSFAECHSVANTACYSVEKLQAQPPADLLQRWREIKNKAVVKDITQRAEYQKIAGAFEKAQLRMLPLKGCQMKSLYPKPDMRLMSDLDILIDAQDRKAARKLMLQMGYACEEGGGACHDNYHKLPVMCIEIHHRLFVSKYEKLCEYAAGTFARAEKADGSDFVYRMTDEECYIFFFMHLHKHMSNAGSGIRSVMDCYVLNRSLWEKMDQAAVRQTLEALELWEFAEQMRALAQVWFAGGERNAQLDVLAEWVLSSGTYGTLSNSIAKQIKQDGRAKLLLKKLFLSPAYMKSLYPTLQKAPVLLPFFWIKRLTVALVKKRKRAFYMLRLIVKQKGQGAS